MLNVREKEIPGIPNKKLLFNLFISRSIILRYELRTMYTKVVQNNSVAIIFINL